MNWRFPAERFLSYPGFDRLATKVIWLVISLQYYVLTKFSGGFSVDAYVPSAGVALGCVLIFVGLSAVLGLVYPFGRAPYAERLRSLMASLLLVWGGSLALLTASYFATGAFELRPRDVVCSAIGCRPTVLWSAWANYAIYATAAAGLATLLWTVAERRRLRIGREADAGAEPRPRPTTFPAPNLWVVIGIVGLVMALLRRTFA